MPSTPCDDEDPCTYDDQCNEDGECAGTAYSCEDDLECTKEECLGDGECDVTILPGACLINGICYAEGDPHPDTSCRECLTSVSKTEWSDDDTNECEDGNPCDVGDHCSDGVCVEGTESLACDDDNPCTDDSCEPETGCVFASIEGACDDGNLCTKGDICVEGTCAGTLVDCDDANECTQDDCDPGFGCDNQPISGPCDDGDGCTVDDQCGDDGVCVGTPCAVLGLYCIDGECIETVCSALNFDGEDDYVEVLHSDSLSLTDEFTVEIWFRPEATASDRALLRKGAGVANYFVWLRPDMTISCGMYVAGGDASAYYTQAASPIEAGVWHHVAMTFDGASVLAYQDGSMHASTDVLGTVKTNTSPLTFGYGYPTIWPDAFADGLIDEVRIWDRVLSQEEIQDKALKPLEPETEIGLVGWWDFNEGQGDIVHDLSGNDNHGTVYGAGWTDEASGPICCSTDCEGKECGGDDCGGSCGDCPDGLMCSGGSCICIVFQKPTVKWETETGGVGKDAAYAMAPTNDGGILLVGETASGNGNGDLWAGKVGASGEIEWQQALGGAEKERGMAVTTLPDGTFLVAGDTASKGAGGPDGWLLRIDDSGQLLWDSTFGGEGADHVHQLAPLTDGGFLAAGATSTDSAGGWDLWVVRFDQNYEVVWSQAYGGEEEDWPLLAVEALPDGGFVLVGGTKSKGAGDRDFWLIRLDENGGVMWDKTFGGAGQDTPYGIAVLSDGGFVVVGTLQQEATLLRTDDAGNVIWQRAYGIDSTDVLYSLYVMSDGGFLMGGYNTSATLSYVDGWLVRTDSNGNLLWEQTYGTVYEQRFRDSLVLPDGEFVAAGFRKLDGDPAENVWVLRTDSECCIPDCEGKECGDDGCGGNCGECEDGGVCKWDKCFAQVIAAYALIPAGTFTMGTPDGTGDEPAELCRSVAEKQHQVELTHEFYMKQTAVTQAEWQAVMGVANNPSAFKACGPDCPVENVSWLEAAEFCNELSKAEGLEQCYVIDGNDVTWPNGYQCKGYRFPTEAEWEYAARAGTTTAFHIGDITECDCGDEPNLQEIGWYCGNSEVDYEGCFDESGWGGAACVGTHPVAQKEPNAWGLYDMAGSLWECCWDWYQADFYAESPTQNPVGPPGGTYRVSRGGSWYAGGSPGYGARFCRSGARHTTNFTQKSSALGIRPVRSGNCFPLCEGKECGDDGCGGSCGECEEPAFCYEAKCELPIVLPDTGQTKCYDEEAEIPCPAQGEPFYGQDGTYVGTPLMYEDNGDGTVTDLNMGLVWAKCPAGQTGAECSGEALDVDWQTAVDHCEQNVDGLPGTDWRLATRTELLSVMDFGVLGSLDLAHFGASAGVVWTGTDYPFSAGNAYAIQFANGSAGAAWNKTEQTGLFRCVRGEPLVFGKLEDAGDGTVADLSSAMIWQKTSDGQKRTWQEALVYCEDLVLAGHDNWRLPTARELATLMDYTLPNASLDEAFFPDAVQLGERYWTGTTMTAYPYAAYSVDHAAAMGYSANVKTNAELVRCVRRDCESDCAGKECGDDGCGGTCGSCPEGTECSNNLCVTE